MKIKILNSEFSELGVIEDVLSAEKREGLNSYKELQFSTILTPKVSALIAEGHIAEVDNDYFDLVYFQKAQQSNGRLSVAAEFEHVSYRLNDPEYDIEFFTEIGTPEEILEKILAGTGFTIGTVEFSETITFSIQEKSSRRKVLMEFMNYLGGEVDFKKFQISILKQRGSTVPKNITAGRNIEVITMSYDKRQKDDNGNPLVAYTCKLIRPMNIELGDVVTVQYDTLGINANLRVVSISTNPYNSFDVEFEIGNFNPTLENDIYRIETSTITKDKLYHGCRIGPEYGFECIRNDKKARAYMNSENLAFQAGDGSGKSWKNKLYYDIDTETGEAELFFAGKFEVETVVSNETITQVLYAHDGRIARLTVDHLLTGDFISGSEYIYFIEAKNQYLRFIVGQRRDDLPKVHYINNGGQPLYWDSADNQYITTDVTDYPVMVYVYDLTTKMQIDFEKDSSGEMVPKIVLGAGVGNEDYPTYGKGYIFKDTDGLLLKYITSQGKEMIANLYEEGIDITYKSESNSRITFKINEEGITQIGNTGPVGLRNIAISDTPPTSPQLNDLWIDTNAEVI
jgi:hypothetical protein